MDITTELSLAYETTVGKEKIKDKARKKGKSKKVKEQIHEGIL